MDPTERQKNMQQEEQHTMSLKLPQNKWLYLGIAVLVLFLITVSLVFLTLVKEEKAQQQNETDTIVMPTKTSEQTVVTATQQPVESAEMQKALEEARRSAGEYDTWQAENLASYPWLRKLPLAADNYYFYFSTDKKIFIGKLYPKPGENIEQTKIFILQQAQMKEIHYQDYNVQWVVNSKPNL